MLPALLVAAACAGWHAGAVGHYRGEVESRGLKPIDTWLEETPAGLAGTYVLHEPDREVTGTLHALGDADCEVGLFEWNDLYGSGTVRLRFYPEAHCFDGIWGLEAPRPDLVWHACGESRVTS